MIDLMDKQVAKMDQCRMLVLDEADKLLSQDFKGMLDMVISRYVNDTFLLLIIWHENVLKSLEFINC